MCTFRQCQIIHSIFFDSHGIEPSTKVSPIEISVFLNVYKPILYSIKRRQKQCTQCTIELDSRLQCVVGFLPA